MILTDLARRWNEVRFYHYCNELFQLRQNILDVVLAIEAVAQIGGNLDVARVKALAGSILSDPYYASSQEEFIVLAYMVGITQADIARHYGKQRNSIARTIKAYKDKLLIYPKLTDPDHRTIIEFFEHLEKFKNIGL